MKSAHNRIIRLLSNMLWLIEISLILLNTSWGIFSIPKDSKFTPILLSINNETQYVPLLCLSSRFMTYIPSFILGKLYLEKTTLNLGLQLKYLVISILLKGWSRNKTFYPNDPYYILWLFSWHLFQPSLLLFQKIPFYKWSSHRCYHWSSHRC